MLRYFRTFRQRLLSQNRVSRYLLYAAGEIVLVVIGILIALQINNWNEARKLRVQEIRVYEEIRHELSEAILDIQDDLDDHRRDLRSNEIVLAVILDRTAFQDSLMFHLALTTDREQLDLKTSGFEALKSTGFDILTNDSIRRAITNLYQGVLPAIVGRNRENGLLWHIDEKTTPRLESHFTLNPDAMNGKPMRRGDQFRIKDYQAFLEDELLLVYLQSTRQRRKIIMNEYQRLIKRIEEIMLIIDNELQKFGKVIE